MATWAKLWNLSKPIDAHIGVFEQGDKICLVEGDFWVPFLIDEILELNENAQILHIWDIDEHRRITWNMWIFSDQKAKQDTQNHIRKLLEKHNK